MQMPFYTSEVRSCRIEKKKERDTSRTFLRIRFNSLGLRSHVNRRQIKEAKKEKRWKKRGKIVKLKGLRQELRVTLISPASTSGKQDIELQSGTRTWAVFGCSSVLSSFYLHRVRSSRRSLARFTKRMHDATSYQIFLSPFSFYRLLSISLFLSFTTKLVVRPSTLDISDSKHNFSPGGLYACRGILPW